MKSDEGLTIFLLTILLLVDSFNCLWSPINLSSNGTERKPLVNTEVIRFGDVYSLEVSGSAEIKLDLHYVKLNLKPLGNNVDIANIHTNVVVANTEDVQKIYKSILSSKRSEAISCFKDTATAIRNTNDTLQSFYIAIQLSSGVDADTVNDVNKLQVVVIGTPVLFTVLFEYDAIKLQNSDDVFSYSYTITTNQGTGFRYLFTNTNILANKRCGDNGMYFHNHNLTDDVTLQETTPEPIQEIQGPWTPPFNPYLKYEIPFLGASKQGQTETVGIGNSSLTVHPYQGRVTAHLGKTTVQVMAFLPFTDGMVSVTKLYTNGSGIELIRNTPTKNKHVFPCNIMEDQKEDVSDYFLGLVQMSLMMDDDTSNEVHQSYVEVLIAGNANHVYVVYQYLLLDYPKDLGYFPTMAYSVTFETGNTVSFTHPLSNKENFDDILSKTNCRTKGSYSFEIMNEKALAAATPTTTTTTSTTTTPTTTKPTTTTPTTTTPTTTATTTTTTPTTTTPTTTTTTPTTTTPTTTTTTTTPTTTTSTTTTPITTAPTTTTTLTTLTTTTPTTTTPTTTTPTTTTPTTTTPTTTATTTTSTRTIPTTKRPTTTTPTTTTPTTPTPTTTTTTPTTTTSTTTTTTPITSTTTTPITTTPTTTAPTTTTPKTTTPTTTTPTTTTPTTKQIMTTEMVTKAATHDTLKAVWSSWYLFKSCFLHNGQYVEEYRRTCLYGTERSRCKGSEGKIKVCESQPSNPISFSKTGKIKGRVRVFDIEFEGIKLPNHVLQMKLNQTDEKEKLQKSALEALEIIFISNNVLFLEIIITKMMVGSLIIEYVVVFETKDVKNLTLHDVNPIKDTATVFKDNDVIIKGRIGPTFSHVTDYDECKESTNSCDENAHCLKFPGHISYACQCKDGYQGDGFKCDQDQNGSSSNTPHLALIIALCFLAFLLILISGSIYKWLKKKEMEYHERSKATYYGRCHSDSFQFEIIRKTTLEHNKGMQTKSAILNSCSTSSSVATLRMTDHDYDTTSLDHRCDSESITQSDTELHEYDRTSICQEYDATSITKLPDFDTDSISPPPDYDSLSIVSREYREIEETKEIDMHNG